MIKTLIYKLAFLSIIWLFPALSNGQNIKSVVNVDTVTIGGQIELKLLLTGVNPNEVQIVNKFKVKDSLADFEIIKKGKIDSALTNGNYSFTQIITLTSFSTGEQLLPAISAVFKNKRYHNVFTITTAPVIVMVKPADVTALSEYHDVRNIIMSGGAILLPQNNYVILTICAALAVAIIIIGIKIRRRARVQKRAYSFKDALFRLRSLRKKDAGADHSGKQVSQQVYRIINEFIAYEFNDNAQCYTSEELLSYCDSLPLSPGLKKEIQLLVKKTDDLRFGKDAPENLNENLINAAIAIVENLEQFRKQQTKLIKHV